MAVRNVISWGLISLLLTTCLATPTATPRTVPATAAATPTAVPMTAVAQEIALPEPRLSGPVSLEETLVKRRSVREYTAEPLSVEQLSQLLWACQGITHPAGLRTAPSAGALYPLDVYVATADAAYHYIPQGHKLQLVSRGDARPALSKAAVGQEPPAKAPAVFVITGVYQRTAQKYGERAQLYVHLEAGHAAQNILLQAVALGLGGVPIGAFYEDQVQAALRLPPDHEPLYIIAVGHPGT